MPITRNKPSQTNLLTSGRCYDSIIGIDPDTHKSGVAIISTKRKTVELFNLPNENVIYDIFRLYADDPTVQLVIEAGWLNASNWHAKAGQSHRVAAKIGSHTGANHEAGRILVACARKQGFEVVEQRPLRKTWRGRDGKITHDELSQIIHNAGYTYPIRSNQETRDAALIAWSCAGLAMVIKPNI